MNQYLNDRYPGSRVLNFEFLTSGFESDVYTLTLELSGQIEKPVILRLYPGGGAAQKMAREAAGLLYLQQAGYPVPAVLNSEPDPIVLGKPFTMMEKLDGQNLWPLLAGAEKEQATGLLNRFGALIAQLHRLDWASFDESASKYQANPVLLLKENFAASRQEFEHYGIPGFLPIFDWLEEKLEQVQVKPAIVHLDFHANNVLVCNDGRMVVIDWTQVTIDDYRTDLSWTLFIMGEFGKADWAEQILRAYTVSAGHAVDDLPYFDVISYIKFLSSAIISLKVGPTNLGLRAETADSIQRQAPIYRALLRRVQNITGLSIPEVEAAFK